MGVCGDAIVHALHALASSRSGWIGTVGTVGMVGMVGMVGLGLGTCQLFMVHWAPLQIWDGCILVHLPPASVYRRLVLLQQSLHKLWTPFCHPLSPLHLYTLAGPEAVSLRTHPACTTPSVTTHRLRVRL